MPARRFPPPWSVEEQPACFVVRDHNGQQLAYVYFEDEPGRRLAAKLISKEGNANMICIHHFYAFRALKLRASQRTVPNTIPPMIHKSAMGNNNAAQAAKPSP
jgi:hypothetical protein